MAVDLPRVHVDDAGDYVIVPEDEFDAMVRTLELLANEEFQEQFEKSKQSEGTALADLKAKYGIED